MALESRKTRMRASSGVAEGHGLGGRRIEGGGCVEGAIHHGGRRYSHTILEECYEPSMNLFRGRRPIPTTRTGVKPRLVFCRPAISNVWVTALQLNVLNRQTKASGACIAIGDTTSRLLVPIRNETGARSPIARPIYVLAFLRERESEDLLGGVGV